MGKRDLKVKEPPNKGGRAEGDPLGEGRFVFKS